MLKLESLDWLFFLETHIRQRSKISKMKLFKEIFIFTLKLIFNSFKRKRPITYYEGHLVYIDNTRHFDLAKIILPFIEKPIVYNKIREKLDAYTNVNITQFSSGYYKSLYKYLPNVLYTLITKNSYVLRNQFTMAMKGLLLYEVFKEFLENNNIESVVLFTDHSYKNRIFLFAAKEKKISTHYVPHASVSTKFPPLEFTYAYLEGIDMQSKYDVINRKWNFNSKTKCIVVGNLKAYHSRTNMRSLKDSNNFKVGIAINSLDHIDLVKKLILKLNNEEEIDIDEIILRPHPSLELEMDPFVNCKLSDAKVESSIDFLSKIDFVVSGDSNIILEAQLLNKPAIMYDFSPTFNDNYGFVQNGLCKFITKYEELIIALKNKSFHISDQDKLNQYDASYGTDLSPTNRIAANINKPNYKIDYE